MKITLRDTTGYKINVDGIDYHKTLIIQDGHGIYFRYHQDGGSKTIDIRKDKAMKQNPEAARVMFDAKNWKN